MGFGMVLAVLRVTKVRLDLCPERKASCSIEQLLTSVCRGGFEGDPYRRFIGVTPSNERDLHISDITSGQC
jgi:hypothetical protein